MFARYYSAHYICPRGKNEFFPTSLGLFPGSSREKSFFFPPCDSCRSSLYTKLGEARGATVRLSHHNSVSAPAHLGRIGLPPPPPPIVRSRRPSCSRSITTSSTFPPIGDASSPPPTPFYNTPTRHHHRRRPPAAARRFRRSPCLRRRISSSIAHPSALLMEPGPRKSLILAGGGMAIHPK